MVQQNLVEYIIRQLKEGKRLEEVNAFLLSAGYDKAEIESSVQYVLNLTTNPKLAEEQRIQQLSAYIKTQLGAGYNSQAVASFLLSRGYPYYEVNSALQQATAPKVEVKTEHRLVVFALIAMFLMTTTVTVMYFRAYTLIGIGVPEKLLDVEADKLTTIVQQGGELAFQVKLINFGYEKRFDVELQYTIVDRETQGTVLEKTETVALSTTLENVVKFDIPETMKAGKYVLRVDAKYKDFTATSGFIFDVLPKELAAEKIEEIKKLIPEKTNVSEIPELAKNVTAVQPNVTTTPTTKPPVSVVAEEGKFYEGKTKQQAFEMVKAVSVREPERAISMCKSFDYEAHTEQCLATIAVLKKDASFCDQINKTISKDRCYLDLSKETGIADFCEKISTKQLKSGCNMFSTVNQIGKEGEVVNNEQMFGLMVTLQQ